jgi:hypothetical protein
MIKAAFFFHYRGSHVQNSFEGMLHSILLRILKQQPPLATILLPEFATLEPERRKLWSWSLPKLMAAYEAVLTQDTFPVDVLLFIDALDEYDGPPEAMVDFMRASVAKSSQGETPLKVCFSSREWSTFEEYFSREPGFKIHERTQDDIRTYIASRSSSIGWTEDERSDMRQMEHTLAERANGVFIWVRAVLDEVNHLYSKKAPTMEVLSYLEGVPDDLDQFYTDAVKRIPHEYRAEAYFMFEALLRATARPLDTFELVEAVSCARLDSLDDCARAITENRRNHEASGRLSWVKDRRAGLVEFGAALSNGTKARTHRVHFMHQTALDFVSRPGFRSIILGRRFALPLENGYSLLAKWSLSRAQATIEHGTPAYPLTGAPTVDLLAFAESSTGRSMKKFLDVLDILA